MTVHEYIDRSGVGVPPPPPQPDNGGGDVTRTRDLTRGAVRASVKMSLTSPRGHW